MLSQRECAICKPVFNPQLGDTRPLDQLRAIDNRRLWHGPLLRLPPAFMAQVNQALREVLDLLEP